MKLSPSCNRLFQSVLRTASTTLMILYFPANLRLRIKKGRVAQAVYASVPPMLVRQVQVCGSKRVGCNAGDQKASRCHTGSESEGSITCRMPKQANINRSPKQRHQCTHKKDLCLPSNNFLKKICIKNNRSLSVLI